MYIRKQFRAVIYHLKQNKTNKKLSLKYVDNSCICTQIISWLNNLFQKRLCKAKHRQANYHRSQHETNRNRDKWRNSASY